MLVSCCSVCGFVLEFCINFVVWIFGVFVFDMGMCRLIRVLWSFV